jgi:hypothetical protein
MLQTPLRTSSICHARQTQILAICDAVELVLAQKLRWSCSVSQFAAPTQRLLKPKSDHGECPFHNQFPQHNRRHFGECPSYNFRQYLRRELRRSRPSVLRCELRRNGPCDLPHHRRRVCCLRVPVHQARRLPASAALAKTIIARRLMTFSFGMDGPSLAGALSDAGVPEENRCQRRDGLKMGKAIGCLY